MNRHLANTLRIGHCGWDWVNRRSFTSRLLTLVWNLWNLNSIPDQTGRTNPNSCCNVTSMLPNQWTYQQLPETYRTCILCLDALTVELASRIKKRKGKGIKDMWYNLQTRQIDGRWDWRLNTGKLSLCGLLKLSHPTYNPASLCLENPSVTNGEAVGLWLTIWRSSLESQSSSRIQEIIANPV